MTNGTDGMRLFLRASELGSDAGWKFLEEHFKDTPQLPLEVMLAGRSFILKDGGLKPNTPAAVREFINWLRRKLGAGPFPPAHILPESG